MSMAERKAELIKRREEVKDLISHIDSAIKKTSGENIHRYEADHGESRHEVERPRLKDLVDARKNYMDELAAIEFYLAEIEAKEKKRQRKTIFFKFDR